MTFSKSSEAYAVNKNENIYQCVLMGVCVCDKQSDLYK